MDRPIDYGKLADIYDVLVRFEEDIPLFMDACGKVSGPVLELMSGTGRVSLPLVAAGVDLTCVDYSEEMLEVLARKLADRRLSARLLKQDVRDLDIDTAFPLAFMPFHSFHELVGEDNQRRALASIYKHLSPGGLFICTLHNPAVRLRSLNTKTVGRLPGGRAGDEIAFRTKFKFNPATRIVEGVETFERLDERGKAREKRSLRVRFNLIDQKDFQALARGAGFDVETLCGDYDRSPFNPKESPYLIYSLRKSLD